MHRCCIIGDPQLCSTASVTDLRKGKEIGRRKMCTDGSLWVYALSSSLFCLLPEMFLFARFIQFSKSLYKVYFYLHCPLLCLPSEVALVCLNKTL